MFKIMCWKDKLYFFVRCIAERLAVLFDLWDYTLKWWESLPWPSLVVKFILEWYSKDTGPKTPCWKFHRGFSSHLCLFGIHTSLKDSPKPYQQHHKPEICCQLSTFGMLLCHLKGGRLDRNGFGICILLLPNLPVSPFTSFQSCPLLLLFSKWWQSPEVAIMSPWKETPPLKPANRR